MITGGDKCFATLNDYMVAVRNKSGFHVRGIGPRRGLGNAQGGEAALSNARQKVYFLLMVSKIDDWLDRMKCGAPNQAGGSTGLPNFPHGGEVSAVGHLRAAVFFGDEHAVQAQFVNAVDIVPGKFAAFIVGCRARADLISTQGAHGV